MTQTVATQQALRIMGTWVRRADAVLADGALANAARAVADEQVRTAEHQDQLALLDVTVAVPVLGAPGRSGPTGPIRPAASSAAAPCP